MKFKVGDKIEIVNMTGEPNYNGREGAIEYIDDIGQLHGTWGGLAVIPDVDTIKIILYKQKNNSIIKLK